MTTDCHIAIVSKNPALRRAVESSCGELASVGPKARTMEELAASSLSGALAVVVVDLSPDAEEEFSLLERLVADEKQWVFVIVCEEMQVDLVLRAMRIGIRHCMAAEQLPQELPGVVREAKASASGPSTDGEVVTILSAGGGCGATTLAVNLGLELHLLEDAPSAVVDLDLAYGSTAIYLSVEGKFGIHDVLADASRIDSELVRSTATSHPSGLDVFLSPFTTGAPASALRLENLGKALDALRRSYRFTIIDAPRLPLDITADLFRRSDTVMLVMELTVPHLRTARQIVGELRARGLATGSLVPVGCRYRRRAEYISLKEASRTLGGLSIEPISNDFETVHVSQMLGKTLAEMAPRSKVRREIQMLAERFGRNSQAGAA